jgi:DNA-binding response OmpR family regulator
MDMDRSKRVLVIDDEEDLTALIELILSQFGIDVYTAFSGQQGLQCFRDVQPDLVIVDVMLPGMTGWDVIKQLRKMSAVPVIIHTVLTDGASQKRGRDLGAIDYITKPYLPQVFAARVTSIIDGYSAGSLA